VSFFSGIKKITKPFVDIPKWIDYQQLVKSNRSFYSFSKKFFIPEQATVEESFEDALQRLGVTEADLVQRRKEFTRLLWLWVALFFISFAYSLHLLSEQALRGFFPCLGFNLVILTQIFRYHFWIFQIKQRRLGCSFRDWLHALFFSGKKPNEENSP
jgi:intracellular multiplication protein IcmV